MNGPYDELLYEDHAFYHTHPGHLAAVATLRGLQPPAVERCRVLELGCGTGFNLAAMAQSLPDARLVGVDLSSRQIEYGRALAAAVGGERIELHALDVAALDPAFGEFDYIVAHGIFSWVSEAVREAILTICKRHLAPNGIAYVSYNTYPGWHLRTIVRDMLRFHAPAGAPPLEQVRRARAGLEQVLAALPDPDSQYGRFLRAEAEALRGESDVYLFHECLAPDNQPLHFAEFARMASAKGLRFLAEARFGTNTFAQDADMQQAFDAVSDDLVRREQQSDFIRNRFFRQSLLCHAELQPSGSPSLDALFRLRILCRVTPLDGGSAGSGGAERFDLGGAGVIETDDPALIRLLHRLHRAPAWPRPIPVGQLAAGQPAVGQQVAEADDSLDPDSDPPGIPAQFLLAMRILRGHADGLWPLLAHDPPFVARVGERPRACPLARWAAARTDEVTNRLHRPVRLTVPQLALLRRLDGRTTRDRLASELAATPEAIDDALRLFAESALLVG